MREVLKCNKKNIGAKFIATRANGCLDNPFEMTVLEFSDSGKYVKWKNIQNLVFWDLTDDFEILDTVSNKIDFSEFCLKDFNKNDY